MDVNYGLPLSPSESVAAEKRAPLSVGVVYETIRREGQAELERSTPALAWSGLAAGLSMGFSLLAQAVLQSHMPTTAPWGELLSKVGYAMGFVVVILARQQLFTENTLTPILPLFINRDRATLLHVARLWSTVLMANLAGASLFALGLASGKFVDRTVIDTCTAVALASVEGSALDFFLRGIVSGWLIALMVWMLPSAQQSRLTIIVAITYLVALADLSHVVAGAVDVFYLAFRHVHSFGAAFGYIGPTLLGNVLGGIALTAALNHAQTVAPSLQT